MLATLPPLFFGECLLTRWDQRPYMRDIDQLQRGIVIEAQHFAERFSLGGCNRESFDTIFQDGSNGVARGINTLLGSNCSCCDDVLLEPRNLRFQSRLFSGHRGSVSSAGRELCRQVSDL